MLYTIRLYLLAAFYLFISCNTAYAVYGTNQSWDAMVDGIKTFSTDKKLKEEFTQLCKDYKTALVNGTHDTGGGLYMVVDRPVYSEPAKSRITELRDKDIVALTEDTALVNDTEWVKIKFLFISDYSQAAVSIDDGWIEKSNLRITP